MEPLVIIAGITWVIAFLLVLRFSKKQYKYYNSNVNKEASVKAWKTLGVRTGYYRLVIGFSGLITMAVVAIAKSIFFL